MFQPDRFVKSFANGPLVGLTGCANDFGGIPPDVRQNSRGLVQTAPS